MIPDTFTIRGETFHVASWPVRIAAEGFVDELGRCLTDEYSHGKRPPS
jgi:hypothetical protein